MSQADVLRVLKRNDGIEISKLYDKLKHLFSRDAFNKNVRRLIKGNDIMKIERTKYYEGVKKITIKVFICE